MMEQLRATIPPGQWHESGGRSRAAAEIRMLHLTILAPGFLFPAEGMFSFGGRQTRFVIALAV